MRRRVLPSAIGAAEELPEPLIMYLTVRRSSLDWVEPLKKEGLEQMADSQLPKDRCVWKSYQVHWSKDIWQEGNIWKAKRFMVHGDGDGCVTVHGLPT